MQITENQFNQLIEINNTLGEIYTKGKDSILLVQCRQALYDITNDIHALSHSQINIVDNNEDKKE